MTDPPDAEGVPPRPEPGWASPGPPPEPAWSPAASTGHLPPPPSHGDEYPGAPVRTSKLAITALITGLVGLSPLALILAIAALVHIKEGTVKGKEIALGAIAVSVCWILIIGGAALNLDALRGTRHDRADGRVSPASLRVGDCFTGPAAKEAIGTVDTVPCTRPHTEEIVAQSPLPDGPYPGEAEIRAKVAEVCRAQLRRLRKSRYADDLELHFLRPDETAWRNGKHTISCVLHFTGHDTLTAPFAATIDEAAKMLQEMAPGDCFQKWRQGPAQQRAVPCGEPHLTEVYAVRRLPAGPYPGTRAMARKSSDYCAARGKAIFKARWVPEQISYAYPPKAGWAEGSRVLVCIAESLHGPTKGPIVPR
ncbi:septum formation family protein [Actinomadura roseirufa]|uniref:septum formation family protein n=1 Tax=Actinomadura roseirufa TaxID=2094049 RepID=UPI0010414DF4|nr:septum formation family protein [Actinomadura roseirufa]